MSQKETDANTKAAESTHQSAAAYLTELEKISPQESGAVRGCLDLWDTRDEETNYQLAAPLLDDYARLRPAEAQTVGILKRNWRARLNKHSTTSPG